MNTVGYEISNKDCIYYQKCCEVKVLELLVEIGERNIGNLKCEGCNCYLKKVVSKK